MSDLTLEIFDCLCMGRSQPGPEDIVAFVEVEVEAETLGTHLGVCTHVP